MAKRLSTTRWSVVLAAGGRGDAAREALDALCRTYRDPLIAFALHDRAGRSREDAEDLVQAFITDLLGRGDLAALDPTRGSFRAWLFQSMRHFIARRARDDAALKRGGGERALSLDATGADGAATAEPREASDAERLFHRRWALVAVRRALERVRADVAAGGPDAARLFDRLKDRIVEPGEDGYADLASELGVQPTALRARVYRWRRLVRAEIADTLCIDADVDLEIEELLHAL